ncbi:MAG: alpha/beta fold hydrolase [Acidimicrobiales bacterium]
MAERDRPAVVLLHAFPMDARMWQPQVDALSDRWRVVTPEVDFTRYPTVDAMADAVAILIAEQELAPVVLGGLSMGGYVALAVLRRHPEVVRALVLADTRAGADTDEVRERRTKQQGQVAEAASATPVTEAMVGALPGATTKADRPDVIRHIAGLMDGATVAGVTAALEAMKARPDSTGDLAGIGVPTLVVVGEEDGVSPPDVAQDMARRLPNARLAVIPGAGHLSNLETPEAFNRELLAFLDGFQLSRRERPAPGSTGRP